MKFKNLLLAVALLIGFTNLNAQDKTETDAELLNLPGEFRPLCYTRLISRVKNC